MLLAFGQLSFAAPGHAQTSTPVVTIDAQGWPDRAPPLGEAFYLSGPASKSVDAAYAIFVRRRWAFWGLGKEDPQACERLSQQLGMPPNLNALQPGLTWERTLWPKAQANHQVLAVQGSATHGESTDTYRVLVPAADFFRPGASYCMFVYLRNTVTRSQKVDIKQHLRMFGESIARCKYGAAPVQSSCQQSAVDKLMASVEAAVSALKPADSVALVQAVQKELINDALRLFDRRRIQNILGQWAVRATAPDGTLFPTGPGQSHGNVLCGLLALTGHEPTVLSDHNGCKTTAGETILGIGLSAKFSQFILSVAQAGGAGAHISQMLNIEAHDVVLPNSKVSLQDAWRFALGELRSVAEYIPIRSLWSHSLGDAMLDPGDEVSPQSLANVAAVRDAFLPFAELLDHRYPGPAAACARNGVANEDTKCVLERDMGALLAPVMAEKAQEDAVLARGGGERPAEEKHGLYYDTQNLVVWLDEWYSSAQSWNAAPQRVAEIIEQQWVQANRLMGYSSHAGLTQQSWFDMYLTPIVGRTMVISPSATFSEWSLGLQVFGYANPVNEPMWFNGKRDDARRMLALELAVIPRSSGVGPNSRFTGTAAGVPPIMFGAALQLIPYVTVSAGGVLLREHETGIAGEAWRARVRPYLSLSVQANVPGIVRQAVVPASTLLMEGGKK